MTMNVSVRKPNTSQRRNRNRPAKPVDRDPLVLFVDDDDDLTRIVKARFERHRIRVSRAGSGREGLRAARSQRPTLIITDLGMSGGDGEYLLRRLASRPSTATIPLVVLSGLGDADRIAAAHSFGVAKVLRKPMAFEQLIEELMPFLTPESSQPDCSGAQEDNHTHDRGACRSSGFRFQGRCFRLDQAHGTQERPSFRRRTG